MEEIYVRDIMAPKPFSCTPDASVTDIAQLMEECDCGAIPIVDKMGMPKGIVTDRDMTIRVIAQKKPADQLKASDVMTPVTVTVKLDTPASQASKIMAQKKVRRLLVVNEEEKFQGILSLADLSRACPAEYTGRLVKKISEPTKEASQV